MAHRRRDERVGYHHVVARGNNKREIFVDDDDRETFIDTLNRKANRHGWEILAYCLMRNHYHLVLRVDERGLSAGMCELNTTYATRFNTKHGRINHLFGKRYWSAYLGTEARLLSAIRYVVQNPQRAGLVGSHESYVWSSYRASIGLALPFARLAVGELLELFGSDPRRAIAQFRAFCEDTDPPGHVRRQPP